MKNRDLLTQSLIVAVSYFVTGWLGLQIPYAGSHITLLWLPTGIAVAALLRCGFGVWPGIFLGACLVNLSTGSPALLALSIAAGNTLAPLLSAVWLKRSGFDRQLTRQRDIGLLLAAAALGMVVSASLGVTSLYLAGLTTAGQAWTSWLAWWMGDSVGVLLAAPLLLSMTPKSLHQLIAIGKELALWAGLAAIISWLVFVADHQQFERSLPLAFLTLPMLTWAALRFGQTGAAIASLLFFIMAAWSTAMGHGPFALSDSHFGLFLLWAYMATIVLTALLVTAVQSDRLHAEHSLRSSEEKLRGVFELSPLGIALTNMQGNFVEFNEAFRKLTGYTAEELKALDYWALTPKHYAPEEDRQLESLAHSGHYGPYEKEYIHKNGQLIPLRLNGMLITGSNGKQLVCSIVEDISDRKQLDADLRIAASVFDSQESMLITDSKGVILRINQAFIESTGYSAEEVIGKTPSLFKSGRHDAAFYQAMWRQILDTGSWQGEIWDRRKDGNVYPKWLTISAVKGADGATTHYVGTHFDITERKRNEEKIKSLAFYDQLTGLPNRTLLLDRLKQTITASARSNSHGALLFIDLDNFKTLNDTLGHDMGDLLLKEVSIRLDDCVREGDTVARLGGDEFVVVLGNLDANAIDAAQDTEAVAEKILSALNQPYQLGTTAHSSSASIGATLFRDKESTVDNLMKQADLAMYRAKAAGRNTVRFFDPAMETSVIQRVAMEKDLRQALLEKQFQLYYQAQVNEQGKITGAEALIRWLHPQRGIVSPADFIPLAEENGQILPLGAWVLETACHQLAAWSRHPAFAELTLAVNVSAHQFRQSGFVAQVLAALQESKADPRRLKLELTESLLVEDVEDVTEKMQALKAHGIAFSLDDFGTGYSSLSYLRRLPLDQLKIDQSFVRDALIDHNDAAIAETIIMLACSLQLEVIAEGVETAELHDYLARLGCPAFQGYYFSKPVPVAEFETLVISGIAQAQQR